MNNNQQNYYGDIQLLNDLHNYFPEILYGARFQNDGLVQYIREVVNRRFNLFTNAQNNYRNTQYQQNQQSLQQQQVNRLSTMNTNQNTFQVLYRSPPVSSFVNLLQTMIDSNLSPISQDEDHILNDLQPVVVRPTENQIENGSSIVELTSGHNVCAICQEPMLMTNTIRRLNHCRHMFHNSCIMSAFATSPRCPNCRHDIRSN
uniref:RING-type domain-containing protein n=1 Tax=viral metagenome TaxID=1070528 RepID=A0A6C0IHB6_9ZZZZ